MSASLLIRSLIAGAILIPSLAAGPGSDETTPRVAAWSIGNEFTVSALQPPAPGEIAEWVAATRDNGGLPFFVIDKIYAQLYVFDPAGNLQAVTPVTLDAERKDGRFVAARNRDIREEGVVPAASAGNVVDEIVAGSRVVVYVVPETLPAANAVPDYLRYAANQR